MQMSRLEIISMAKKFNEDMDIKVLWIIQDFILRAILENNEELTFFLLDIFEPNIVESRLYDKYFIEETAKRGWTKVVEKLISLGVNPTFGLLPAVSAGNKKMVELLIDHKADVYYNDVLSVAKENQNKSREREEIYELISGFIEICHAKEHPY